MDALKDGSCWVLRLDKDEDLFSTLESWAEEEDITLGQVSGIGALKNIELGFYHLRDKKYERKKFPKEAELLSLQGNISLFNEKPFFHLHAVLGDENYCAFGGHLFKADIAVTLEIYIRPFSGRAAREPNHEVGLNLLNFCKMEKNT